MIIPFVDRLTISLEAMQNSEIISNSFCEWLIDNGFKTAPASTKYHGAYEGGLYEHCKAVTYELLNMTDKLGLKWQRSISPYIVGMFHDICKIDCYKTVFQATPNGDAVKTFIYNEDTLIKGHGDKSVMLLSQFMTLTEEEMLCIRYHMGAYEKDDWKQFDLAIKKYPTVLFTHTADMLASKLSV